MSSRLRTRRSSTMRPPWMMPMRRIFGFDADPVWGWAAAAVAMLGSSFSVGRGFFCNALGDDRGRGTLSGSRLERCVRDAVEDLRDEVLLQLLPVVVDAGLLVEEEG